MEAQKALSSSELPSVSTGQKTAISPDFVDMTHLYKETTAPMENVSIPRYFTLPKKTHVFTSDEMKAILAHFGPEHPFHMPIMLSYCCGMRLGECLALTWDQVDFENRVIEVKFNQYDKRSLPQRNAPKLSQNVLKN